MGRNCGCRQMPCALREVVRTASSWRCWEWRAVPTGGGRKPHAACQKRRICPAVTYMRDKENSTASPVGTYISNSTKASLITTFVIASFWAAPYAAKAITAVVSGGLPLTVLFGHVFTLEEIEGWALLWTQGFAALNLSSRRWCGYGSM